MYVQKDVLYHHGVQGMKWGQRNGPPYPLNAKGKAALASQRKHSAPDGSSEGATKKKKKFVNPIKSYVTKRKRLAALEKARATKAANEEARRKQAEHDAKRDEVIRRGSATEVAEYAKELTPEEYKQVFDRLDNENKLMKMKADETPVKKGSLEKAKDAFQKMKDVSVMAQNAIDAYNVGAKVVNNLTDANLPIIQEKKATSWDDEKKRHEARKAKVEADKAELDYKDYLKKHNENKEQGTKPQFKEGNAQTWSKVPEKTHTKWRDEGYDKAKKEMKSMSTEEIQKRTNELSTWMQKANKTGEFDDKEMDNNIGEHDTLMLELRRRKEKKK